MPRDEYDDRPRGRRRPAGDYDPEDDYDDRPRARRKKNAGPAAQVLGGVSLLLGILALVVGFGCGGIGIVPGVIGLGLGIIGCLVAHQSRRRQSLVLPFIGTAVCTAAVVVSVVMLVWFVRGIQQFEKDFQAEMAKAAQEEAEREAERAKAATEVEAAAAGGAVRVTAREFYKAWEEDEEQFDALYKKKVVEITGVFDEIDFAGADGYTVLLKAGRDQETVDCVFAKKPEVRARLARLKPGDRVTIRGKCLGGAPELEACVLVE